MGKKLAELKKYFFLLFQAMNRPSFFPLPEFVWNFVFGPERAVMITKGQKIVPKAALESGFVFKYGKISEACAEFAVLFYKDNNEG